MRPVSKGLDLTTFCQVIVVSPRPHDIHDISKLLHRVNLDAKPCETPHSCYNPALEPAPPSLLSDARPSTTGRAGLPSSPPTNVCTLRSAKTDSSVFEFHHSPGTSRRGHRQRGECVFLAPSPPLYTHRLLPPAGVLSLCVDERGVSHLHWRLQPRRTGVQSCRICTTSSSPGSPPRAHNCVPAAACPSALATHVTRSGNPGKSHLSRDTLITSCRSKTPMDLGRRGRCSRSRTSTMSRDMSNSCSRSASVATHAA